MPDALTALTLIHFRNHQELMVNLAPQTVIIGPNGAGKTNILEAVAMLSVTTSWRTERDSEVIQWGAPFTRMVGGDREMVIQRHPYYKRYRIDGVSKRAGEVLGSLPTVLFQPDDVSLVHGAPSYRRSTIDRLLSQANPLYAKSLTQLQRVVKQRNKLLKMIQDNEASVSELSYWDEELAAQSELIHFGREQALPLISETTAQVFSELISTKDVVRIEYHQSPRREAGSFLEHLQQNRHKELAAGVTLYGPHREDIEFFWGEHPAAEGMSRGQVRALVIAYKVAELRYIENKTEVRPILLLDDVLSEFDEQRRGRVVELAGQYQSIMTATELGGLKGKFTKKVEVIELK